MIDIKQLIAYFNYLNNNRDKPIRHLFNAIFQGHPNVIKISHVKLRLSMWIEKRKTIMVYLFFLIEFIINVLFLIVLIVTSNYSFSLSLFKFKLL